MKILIIIFIALSSALSLASLSFVGVDVYKEQKERKSKHNGISEKKESAADTHQDVAKAAVQETTKPVDTVVEQIDAERADELLSDTAAMSAICYEHGVSSGSRDFVNIGDIDRCFEPGDTVTIDELKKAGLVQKRTVRVKVLADGYLTKPLTVKAHSFSIQAVKMIRLTGGTAVVLRGEDI